MSGEIGFFPDDARNAFRVLILEIEEKVGSLLKKNDYGEAIATLGIIPTIYPQWMLDKQKSVGREIKERRLLRHGDADYRLFINHDAFVTGTLEERRKLLQQNVLTVVHEVGQRVKEGFDAERLEKEIKKEFDL
jgi:Immunity protein 44